ncbi:MAG: BamA/TamA family outer membrane protein [Bacteroidota bacterium]
MLALMGAGCSNTRHLPAGETLFKGVRVVMHDRAVGTRDRKVLKRDLDGIVRPRPNTKTLGMRIKLSLYNLPGGNPNKQKGLRNKLRNALGEPPVLASSVKLEPNKKLMESLLENKGFFRGKATAKWETKRRKSLAVFDVHTGPQYTINKVMLQKDSSQVMEDIDSNFNATLLKPGAPYNLDLIKAERNRIDRMLKEKGYFYFRADYIITVADSSIGSNKVNMFVRVKHDEVPMEAYNKYNIGDVFIYANYRLNGERKDTTKDVMTQYDSYNIIDKRNRYKPKVLADAMLFEKGELYSLDDQNSSLSRLVNMGTFKFVKNRFEPKGDSLLDVYYYLTAMPRKGLRLELGAMTQSDNRTGTNASLSWKNRNAFRGGEQVQFKINGGVENQAGGTGARAPGIYMFGAETSFSFPRFVIPFMDVQTTSRYLPRTLIRLRYNYEFQIERIGISSYSFSYGYNWKESPEKEHQFYPVNLTYVKTDTLGNPEQLNLLYTNLIFDGLILGPTYDYIYNSQIGSVKKSGFYFSNKFDLSGNILGLVQKADYETNPKEIFTAKYAQYVKINPDLRYYYHYSSHTTWASRITMGLGIPYGNSRQLPNVKQFWAGGNSDLRGFPSRLVGPGTFNEQVTYGANRTFQTLGDIKFEINTEIRQKIYQFFHMALFMDAGNIWLYRKNPAFPGGEFTKDFYKQLAVDVGVGFRFDFTILLLRLDLGVPVRKPWMGATAVQPLTGAAVRNNMILNLAIGYPF